MICNLLNEFDQHQACGMASYIGRSGPSNTSIYVCNLPPGTTETMLAEFFGTIGLLKVRTVTMYFFHFKMNGQCSIVYSFSFFSS